MQKEYCSVHKKELIVTTKGTMTYADCPCVTGRSPLCFVRYRGFECPECHNYEWGNSFHRNDYHYSPGLGSGDFAIYWCQNCRCTTKTVGNGSR